MALTAILIPSLGREQYVPQVVGNIEQNTPEPHTQFWMAAREYAQPLHELGLSAEGGLRAQCPPKGFYILDSLDPDKRYVTRMNKLVGAIQRLGGVEIAIQGGFDYVFFGSDDVVFHPFWLTNALNVMENAPNAQVVVVNDLRNQNGTQALVRTSYLPEAVFDDPTAAFHPGYLHNFADTEMFYTAQKRGVCYRSMDSHVEHLHPLHNQGKPDGRKWDKTYADAQTNWNHDAKLWGERKALIDEAVR